MTARIADPRVLPPSIADDRGRAVLAVITRISATFDWRPALAVTWADVPTSMLPYAIRSLSLEEFVQPGMSEAVLRRFIAAAVPLHVRKGSVGGVRFGLGLLGMQVAWRQWFQASPMGPPGTYVATVTVGDEVFEGEGRVLTQRLQLAALKMIEEMKRYSQEGSLRFAVDTHVPVRVGAVVRARLRIRPETGPVTRLGAWAPSFFGAVVRARLRIRPVIT